MSWFPRFIVELLPERIRPYWVASPSRRPAVSEKVFWPQLSSSSLYPKPAEASRRNLSGACFITRLTLPPMASASICTCSAPLRATANRAESDVTGWPARPFERHPAKGFAKT